MKIYLLTLLIIGFTGCTTKKDFVLFNQTEVNKNHVEKQTENDSSNQIEDETINQLENVQFEYKIRPYDRVSIIVYKHPDISTSSQSNMQQERGLLVNAKGYVRLPLIKKIYLQGLTQTEAEDALETAYSVYIKKPDIQIEVLNKRAYVIGEVKRPGEVPLPNEQLTLLQILATAGDLTDTANRKSILIVDGSGNRTNTRVVNLTDIHSLQTANLMIKPNDIVYVMPNDMKTFNIGIKEATPIFTLINQILTPFVNIKFLRD
jgi:polysaccharide export outer membrane protein